MFNQHSVLRMHFFYKTMLTMFRMLNVHFKDAAPFFSFGLHSGFLGLGSKTASLVSSALAHFSTHSEMSFLYATYIVK